MPLKLFGSGATTGRWDVWFDPDSNTFCSGPVGVDKQGRLVPLRTLGDLRRLGRWFPTCGLSEAQKNQVETVQQRLLDYELPAYLVETDDVDALRGVFARLNSTGVRMRADEVFQALGAADAAEALRRAVAFLQAPVDAIEPGAGISAYAFIPYPVVFVILARWFHVFPEPDATTRRELAHWLWRGVTSGVHQRAAVSAMRLQVREIRDDDCSGSLNRLLDAVGEPNSAEWVLDPFHANHAASRVELLALLSLGPRDASGPVSWRALLLSGARVAREIFRIDALDGDLRVLGRTAANRVLLDARHTNLRSELRKWSWEKHRAALESHLIDEAGLEELHATDAKATEAFLLRRGARIRALVGSFLAERAGFGLPRLLPAEAYFDGPARSATGDETP